MVQLISGNQFDYISKSFWLTFITGSPHISLFSPIGCCNRSYGLLQPFLWLLQKHAPVRFDSFGLNSFSKQRGQLVIQQGSKSKYPINKDSYMPCHKAIYP